MRTTWRAIVIASVALAVASCRASADGDGDAAIVEVDEWGQVFEDHRVVGTFAAREVGTNETFVWNLERAGLPERPASTFKILNSMIILQTGVLDDVDDVVAWDGIVRGIDTWNGDHSLRSGIEVSAVWMYQELAREVGEDRMAEWVTAAGYGNANVGGGIDEFWLRGDLRITPLEQLDFLEGMATDDLPFDSSVVADVREIIVREQGNDWTWSYKTGTTTTALGWLVGTTEFDGRMWVFAMNIDIEPAGSGVPIDPQARQSISRQILGEVGALPPA